MAYLRRLSALLAFTLPIALAPGCAPSLSSKGQLIECDVGAGGAISSCQPTTELETDDPDKCVDVDEDGDDDPDDEADDAAEADDASGLLGLPAEDDDDDDGVPDTADDDDDNDGVPDVDDCDEEEGGDDDELDDDDSLDDDL